MHVRSWTNCLVLVKLLKCLVVPVGAQKRVTKKIFCFWKIFLWKRPQKNSLSTRKQPVKREKSLLFFHLSATFLLIAPILALLCPFVCFFSFGFQTTEPKKLIFRVLHATTISGYFFLQNFCISSKKAAGALISQFVFFVFPTQLSLKFVQLTVLSSNPSTVVPYLWLVFINESGGCIGGC